MLSEQILRRQISDVYLRRGKYLYQDGNVSDLEIAEDEINGITRIETLVESERSRAKYFVNVSFGKNGNLMTYECDCPFFYDHYTPCKHIAATLYKYIDEVELGNFKKSTQHVHLRTDPNIRQLIENFAQMSYSPSVNKLVNLQPQFTSIDAYALDVEFKVGYPNEHMYIIQSIDSFLAAFENSEKRSYGKYLNLIHTLSSFDTQSQKLIQFLLSLRNNQDNYSTTVRQSYYYNYYYHEPTVMKKTLTFKGRYLDEFIHILEDTPLTLKTKYGDISNIHIVDELPQIDIHIDKTDNGYLLKGNGIEYAKGLKYLYFLQPDERKCVRTPYDKKAESIYNLLLQNHQQMFIYEDDLPKFSKYIYPVISTKTKLITDAFDPYDYTIPTPTFEIYLDLPQDNTISCEIKAVYPTAVYNIFDQTDNNQRDNEEEKKMKESVSVYFTSFSKQNKEFILQGSDDEIYAFMTETIPYLQSISTVFVSDKLKKLSAHSIGKVSVGVSISHDLLQLNLVSDELSLSQVAEILSKYNKKKKYYRLKDGSFVDINSEEIDSLLALKNTLSLSKSDISKGNIKLPKYRAMYLNSLEDTQAYNLEYDNTFRKMIQKMEEINQESYIPPHDINATLRPYQLDGMRWLCALRDNGFGGLLADEMGLGKTLQVISMLGNWKNRKQTLIVCPASLVYNWSKEIEKFLPSVKHRMIQGTQEERQHLIQTAEKDEVLITSYDLLRRDIEHYEYMQFSCEVIDEAQYIKNANTLTSKAVKLIQADFKIALTGTPIENRLSELWSIFDYLMPGFFYGYETFRKRFELPIVRDNDDLMERELNQMITPFVLRRLKKDVLKDLPDKLEEVYYAPLEGEQKQLYQAEVQKIKLILEKQTDEEFKENKMIILAELTKLRQLCCYPGLLYGNYQENSSKTDMCIDLVLNAIEGGHKILLFSQFTSMLDELKNKLQENQIAYYLLEGKTPKNKRAEMVEKFQQDDVPVFLISLKAGGTGLNLTAADIVIHYDPWWNTAVENQASDRAHRIGQENVVSVYKLIMKDTIEERILELQNQKSDLANRILSGEGMSSSKLSREDLLALL